VFLHDERLEKILFTKTRKPFNPSLSKPTFFILIVPVVFIYKFYAKEDSKEERQDIKASRNS